RSGADGGMIPLKHRQAHITQRGSLYRTSFLSTSLKSRDRVAVQIYDYILWALSWAVEQRMSA
ncbi:hypothetical protein KY389_14750, partial [Paracoccus bogoriensis]|uniref:hypothetical protein n=1 Tax=Paracoccus bogoriensis TaxID=242065 RepID=UPI001CA5860D